MNGSKNTGSAPWALALLAALGAIVALNTMRFPDEWRAQLFLATLVLVGFAFVASGRIINRRPAGLIIDDRNRASLSKLQMLLWTILVIAALVSLAAARLHSRAVEALAIYIPPELLSAMGIAAASFVATPTILNLKAAELPTQRDLQQAMAVAQAQGATLEASGKVHGRADPMQARWSDLFRGDEVGNSDTPDLSKIQQFAITLLLLGVYIVTLFDLFADTANYATAACAASGPCAFPSSLPPLGSQFIMLMGISHASYLVYKASPHTGTGTAPSTHDETVQVHDDAVG